MRRETTSDDPIRIVILRNTVTKDLSAEGTDAP